MKRLILVYVLFLSLSMPAQTSSRTQFSKLSRPEKCWVLFHPFVAKRAFEITRFVIADMDSLKNAGTIGNDLNGGKLDAYKHSYWMANLAVSIGKRRSLKLGKAHEKGNYLQYKRHELEDAILPDSVSSAMDLANNKIGAATGDACKSCTPNDLQRQLIDRIQKGELFIIRKDAEGNYLSCDGTRIDLRQWAGKWSIPKCLVHSDAP